MKRKGKIEMYKDAQGQWRWRIVSANGRILADSGEAYKRRHDCLRGVNVVTGEAFNWDVVVL